MTWYILGRSFWLSSWKAKGWWGQKPREGTGTVTQKGEEGPMLGGRLNMVGIACRWACWRGREEAEQVLE